MNQETTSKEKRNKNIQIALLVGIVVLFPLISFLINMKGAEKGKAFYEKLKNNYGKPTNFDAQYWNNAPFTMKDVKGKVLVIGFTDKTNRDSVLNVLKPIVKTEQFREEVDNLYFLTFDMDNDSTFYTNYINNFTVKDREIWSILRGGASIPSHFKTDKNRLVLVDTAFNIRNFYDISNVDDKRLLVEHIAVMPIKRKQKVEKIEQKKM
jgi:hypothetical protein